MEKKLFEVGHEVETNGGTTMICYEVSDMFAFMAPIEKTEEGVNILVDKTLVYNREISGEVLAPISSITIGDKEEKAE